MNKLIPKELQDLLTQPIVASLTTLMKDGSPQVTPVWFDFDGVHIIVNSAKGRAKDLNMRRDPRVSIAILDPENPYRYLEVRGRVIDVTQEGANAHIDSLSKRYLNQEKYPFVAPGEIRVIYRIIPEHTTGSS